MLQVSFGSARIICNASCSIVSAQIVVQFRVTKLEYLSVQGVALVSRSTR